MEREEIHELVHQAIEKNLMLAKEIGCDSAGGYAFVVGVLGNMLETALISLPSYHIVFDVLKD